MCPCLRHLNRFGEPYARWRNRARFMSGHIISGQIVSMQNCACVNLSATANATTD